MTGIKSFDRVQPARVCRLADMMTYGTGECANSLVMNGIFGFAMLFYTKVLGLDPVWAGLAMSVSVFWEALSEPLMGHISDNTRSRWGRRHPYMLVGGLLMAVCSYLIWTVPDSWRANPYSIFAYLVGMNLLLRTGLTMFFIPYIALGFEMCGDYRGRSRLQGIRQICNMAANFAGPGLAWFIFFSDKPGVQATTVESNYHHMGSVFAVATAFFVLLVVTATFSWRDNGAELKRESNKGFVRDLLIDLKLIILDPLPRWVFVFIFIACSGMVLVSSLQIFVYDDFMKLPSWEKSIAHGSTMVGTALGAFVSIGLANRYDKKGAILIGGCISIAGNSFLALLFLTGALSPQATWMVGHEPVPIALILFVVGHASYWMGNGIMLPISTAMIADVSEIHLLKTGVSKDGGYSAIFSLAMRVAISFSLILSGYCLHAIGYATTQGGTPAVQSASVVWRLGLVTFVVGALICACALLAIRRYVIDRTWLESMRLSRGASLAQ